ncbi:MAG: DinB family protein [Acidobacteria bacterium]|nr:DinB family protein [Acidobacteriota bacterium]
MAMDSQITPSVHQFGLGTGLAQKALDGLTREELRRPAGPDVNPALGVMIHLANTRCSLLRLLSVDREVPWEGRFGRGGAMNDPDQYPELDEVWAVWNEASAQLEKRFEELTDEELSAPAPRNFPVSDKTIRGAINFLAYHEAYHVGQLAYIRKWLGKDPLVG